MDKENLKVLNRMIYNYRRYLFSGIIGEYVNHRRGSSNEFYDFKRYAPGDDLKHINWKAFIRHQKLFTKQFHEEAYFCVHILIDNSRSMTLEPAKQEASIRLAAALAYIAMAVHLPVEVELLRPYAGMQTHFHPTHVQGLEKFLRQAFEVSDKEHFWDDSEKMVENAQKYGRKYQQKSGMVLLISDFLYDAKQMNLLIASLLRGNFETRAVQIIAASERPESIEHIPTGTPLRLVDAESGADMTVAFDPEIYRLSYEAHLQSIRQVLTRHQLPVLRLFSDERATDFIRNHMMELGIIR